MTKAAALLALVALTVVVARFGMEAGAAPAPSTIAVSPGADDGTCNRAAGAARPCGSLQRAYALARCGDAIEMGAGTYGPQRILESRALAECETSTIIRPATGAAVSIDRIDFGSCSGCYSEDVPDRLTLERLKIVNGIVLIGDGQDHLWKDIDGGSFWIEGGQRIRIEGGDWGPCASSGVPTCENHFARQNVITAATGDGRETRGVTIEGALIHDYDITADGDHFECIRTDGGTDITIRGVRFANCETYAMTITAPRGTWLIERNFFGRTCCYQEEPRVDRFSSIVLGDGVGGGRVIIRSNNFGPKQTVVHEGAAGFETVSVTDNILQTYDCLSGVAYAQNLFVNHDAASDSYRPGRGCSATDLTGVLGYVYDGVRLRKDPVFAPVVRAAFESCREPLRPWKVAARIRSQTGKRISLPQLRALLSNRVYLGGSVGVPDRHPAIVSSRLWRESRACAPLLG